MFEGSLFGMLINMVANLEKNYPRNEHIKKCHQLLKDALMEYALFLKEEL